MRVAAGRRAHLPCRHGRTDCSRTRPRPRRRGLRARPRPRLPLLVAPRRALDPLPIAGAEGSYVWDYDGNRYLDFSSQLVNVNIGHQHPKVVAAIQEQAGRLCTIAPQHANDVRGEAARLHRRARPRRPRQGLLHQRRRRRRSRTRSGWRGCTPAAHKVLATYRSYHGNTGAAITATGDPRRWPNESAARASCTSSARTSTARRSTPTHRGAGVRARARSTSSRSSVRGPGDRSPRSSSRPSSAPPASSSRRPATSPASASSATSYGIVCIADEVMAGFGRTGEWFAVDHWGVDARPHHLRQGRQLRATSRSAASSSPTPIAATFDERVFPGGLTYSGHPLACASAVAIDRRDARGGHRRERRAHRRGRARPRPARARRAAPGRSARCAGSASSGRSTWSRDRATREPLVPYGGDVGPADERARRPRARSAACCRSPTSTGSTSCRRAPSPTTEAKEGLAILDEVFAVVDQHYTG